jgi:hypothetical protein
MAEHALKGAMFEDFRKWADTVDWFLFKHNEEFASYITPAGNRFTLVLKDGVIVNARGTSGRR